MRCTMGQAFAPARTTFALFFGNRGFFPDHLAKTGREEIIKVLEAAGAGLESVLKTTVFLKDMGEFGTMNEVYAKYFGTNPPARSTVEVARLPRDVRVEIEAVAFVK